MSKLGTIYEKLREVAHNQTTISYEEVGSLVGLQMDSPPQRNELAELLGEISTRDRLPRTPYPASVVPSPVCAWF